MWTSKTLESGFGTLRQRLRSEIVVSSVSFFLALVVWAVGARLLGAVDVVSSPMLVAADLYEILVSMEWVEHMSATIRRIVYSFAFGIALGTALGVAMGVSKFWEKMFQDYVTLSMTMPGIFAVVFTAMYFGVSDVTPMVASGIVTFGFCALMIFEGIRDIDHRYIEMAQAFGIPRRRVIRRVMLPDVLSEWFSAARYTFGVAWKVVVLAEFIAAQNGIGFVIHEQMSTLRLTSVLSWTVLFLVVILVWEYGVLGYVEKRLFHWRDESQIIR